MARWMLVDTPPDDEEDPTLPVPPEDEDDDEEPVPPPPEPEEEPTSGSAGFHALLAIEDAETGDSRIFAEGALTWRDLPLPLMGLDKTTMGHDQAVLIGRIDRIERDGLMIHGWGEWDTGPAALEIRRHVRAGNMRGISVDADDVESELVVPAGEGTALDPFSPPEELDADGNTVIPMEWPLERATAARIIGATVVPFAAFAETFIEDLRADEDLTPALAASATILDFPRPPVRPPREWFNDPGLREKTPLTVTDDGQIYGHIAAWDDCHISFPDRCVPPPRSKTGYAHFLHGQIATTSGRVAVGQICLRGGHADRHLGMAAAMAHYDLTESVGADVVLGEDRWGIWAAGALRSTVTPEEIRVLMADGVSGDWRYSGGNLELIAISSVPVRGFASGVRTQLRYENGLVASVIATLPPVKPHRVPNERIGDLLAAAIGRTPEVRRAELHRKVHA